MIDVSIIVPLYKGDKYIDSIIRNVELCLCKAGIFAELIFVNDYPNEKLKYREGEQCKCLFLNNERNIGIHASRVHGFEYASGKYIVFLDQDDFLDAEYLISQTENIKDADASVCRLINGDREHYTDSFRFEEVISKEFMMNKWNSIVSPGQVLIRREAIPSIWINNTINNNGADDYFLWLTMFASGCKFKINNSILFHHTINGFNTSCDTNMMIDTEREMVSILKKSSLLEDKEKNQLDDLLNSLIRIHIKQLDNIYVSFQVKKWLENVRIESLKKKIGDRVGIYGAADIGTALFEGIIRIFDAEVIFIDRNAKYISKDVEVYTPDNFPQNLDSIIIAVNDRSIVLNIKEFLTIHTDATIFELGELINNIETK